LEDVQVREKLKHASSKAKKLDKQLQKEKEKVGIEKNRKH
jgi:structural maintenance of chromosome 4